jgi:uncharacterized membrane-anchored protein
MYLNKPQKLHNMKKVIIALAVFTIFILGIISEGFTKKPDFSNGLNFLLTAISVSLIGAALLFWYLGTKKNKTVLVEKN